ncbi:MAG: flagellar basal body rod protein FlgC [Lachnospiraceae bacterium]|jgi:flagellar basal-body rod protein FlgC|nr:flagellar basal body rod protein FlgC [Lachnospiraceae bacterium]MDD5957174.1 flagellar basal body rod protein FlgC [Lachnospiraceae bacterium]MDY3990768.1 flagellar basal body rod protein FlgC [Lachnospiraceae bacterium]
MSLFQSFDIVGSGLTAQRFRMDTISENIANINTTHTEDGSGPYRRKSVIFEEKKLNPSFAETFDQYNNAYKGNGVRVASVFEDTSTDFKMVYDPSNPDADDNGYVSYPNVDTVTEMTNLIDASRAYQANVTVFNGLKTTAQQGISIGSSS